MLAVTKTQLKRSGMECGSEDMSVLWEGMERGVLWAGMDEMLSFVAIFMPTPLLNLFKALVHLRVKCSEECYSEHRCQVDTAWLIEPNLTEN